MKKLLFLGCLLLQTALGAQQVPTELSAAAARLKPVDLPVTIAFSRLVPFFAAGRWGLLHRDSLTEVLPPTFDEPAFFGFDAPVRYQDTWYLIDLASGTAKPYSLPREAQFDSGDSGAPTPPQPPAKGFVVENNRLKVAARMYESVSLVQRSLGSYKTEFWAVVKFKSSGKWGLVNAAGDLLPGTRADFTSLQAFGSFVLPQEQFFVFEKANGERGLLDFSGTTWLLNAFEQVENLDRPWWFRPGDRTFVRFKKDGQWGVIARSNYKDQQVSVAVPAQYDAVLGYAYSFRGKYTYGYEPEGFYFRVKKGDEQFFVDLKGKEYRLRR